MSLKKKILSRILSTLLVMYFLLGKPMPADSAFITDVVFPNSYAFTCSEGIISVRVENVTDLTAYHLEIEFTPGSVDIISVENGGFIPDGLFEPEVIDETNGVIEFGMARQGYLTPSVTGSGRLIDIRVQGLTPGVVNPFIIRPYVAPADPEAPPSSGEGSMLVSWDDVTPIDFDVINGSVTTQSCPPQDVTLSNNIIEENLVVDSVVGLLGTTDPDGPSGFVYTLVNSGTYPDNLNFDVVGDQLVTNAVFNFEVKPSYTIRIRSTYTDNLGSQSIEKVFSIGIADVNDPPILEVFSAEIINESSLLSVQATATDQDTLPSPDILSYSLVALASPAVYPTGAGINPTSGAFSWTPTEAQGPGNYSVNICVSDSFITVCQPLVITVNEVNSPPSGEDGSVSTLEDVNYEFLPADFGFSDSNDIPANLLLAVKITQIPVKGVLLLNGVPVTDEQFVPAAEITSGNFIYDPPNHENGNSFANFTFQVQDNGGTAHGGADLDLTPKTIVINVTSVNDAPAGTNKTITILEDGSHTFQPSDFGFSDPNDETDDGFIEVTITTLPALGTLKLNGISVLEGAMIPFANIGLLVYRPPFDGNGTAYASFTFQVRDDGGTDNGGVDLDSTPNTITFNVTQVNDNPVGGVDHLYVFSYMKFGETNNYVLNFSPATLLGNDSDVDIDPLTATITPGPTSKGVLAITQSGSFTYTYSSTGTPVMDTDTFAYNLSDGHGGNVKVDVNITIDLFPPLGSLTWLAPVVQPEVTFTTENVPLLLKVHLSETTDMTTIEFRWWNTAIDPPNWGGIFTQSVMPGQLDYSFTLNMTQLPYFRDIQVFAYAWDSVGDRNRIRFFIDHQMPENVIFLPLIMR